MFGARLLLKLVLFEPIYGITRFAKSSTKNSTCGERGKASGRSRRSRPFSQFRSQTSIPQQTLNSLLPNPSKNLVQPHLTSITGGGHQLSVEEPLSSIWRSTLRSPAAPLCSIGLLCLSSHNANELPSGATLFIVLQIRLETR